jgi:hypothetical protein
MERVAGPQIGETLLDLRPTAARPHRSSGFCVTIGRGATRVGRECAWTQRWCAHHGIDREHETSRGLAMENHSPGRALLVKAARSGLEREENQLEGSRRQALPDALVIGKIFYEYQYVTGEYAMKHARRYLQACD